MPASSACKGRFTLDDATRGTRTRRHGVMPRLLVWLGVIIAVIAIGVGIYFAVSNKADSPEASSEEVLDAQAAYDSGDFDGAEGALAQAVTDNPADLEARKLLALALAAQGKNAEAIEQYAAVVEADPEDHVTLYRMAMLERLTGETKNSLTHLEAAVELDDNPSYRDELARTYMQVGKYAEAAQLWGTLLEDETIGQEQRVLLLSLQAEAYSSARMYDEAREALEEAVFLAPNDEGLKARLEALE